MHISVAGFPPLSCFRHPKVIIRDCLFFFYLLLNEVKENESKRLQNIMGHNGLKEELEIGGNETQNASLQLQFELCCIATIYKSTSYIVDGYCIFIHHKSN